MGILGSLIRAFLPVVPRPLVERVAAPYVSGATLDSALRVVRQLNTDGASATVDILGESVTDPALAAQFTRDYLELIDALRVDGLDASVSVKPTMIGLNISESLFREHLQQLADRAQQLNIVLTIDMEDHTTTDATLRAFRDLREEGNEFVGCVLQAYLHRTLDDAAALPPISNVRLCKGIYVEPKEIAYKGYQEVRAAYLAALEYLFIDQHYAGIATHDDWLTTRAAELIAKHGLTSSQYEFQMLLGVRPKLRRQLLEAGHRLRVYVPYGADWYAYSLRRLRENPQVGVHVLRALLTGR